jgi:hypothetical protein
MSPLDNVIVGMAAEPRWQSGIAANHKLAALSSLFRLLAGHVREFSLRHLEGPRSLGILALFPC